MYYIILALIFLYGFYITKVFGHHFIPKTPDEIICYGLAYIMFTIAIVGETIVTAINKLKLNSKK